MYRMSEAPPPTENLSIFNAVDFPGISKGKANFPNLQGVLTASSGIIWGDGSYQNSFKGFKLLSTTVYTANDVFTKPADVTAIRVRCVGGGGGGASTSFNNQVGASGAGSGGAGGSYAESFITNVPDTAPIVVGQGGSGGGNTNATGGAGTHSEFGTAGDAFHVKASGGNGGNRLTIAAGNSQRVESAIGAFAPNTATDIVGDIRVAGGASENTLSFGSNISTRYVACSSKGGDSVFGVGGIGGRVVTNQVNAVSPGSDGRQYGGGGGGGATSAQTSPQVTVGGNGANGVVIIELFN